MRNATLRPWRLTADQTGVVFTVPGIAQPKGSPEHFSLPSGRVAVTERGPHKDWQAQVRLEAGVAMLRCGRKALLDGPLSVALSFFLPRPKSAPKTVRTLPQVRPDADKLARCVLDGLNGVVFRDDGQICRLAAWKAYSARPRVEVAVFPVTEEQLAWLDGEEA